MEVKDLIFNYYIMLAFFAILSTFIIAFTLDKIIAGVLMSLAIILLFWKGDSKILGGMSITVILLIIAFIFPTLSSKYLIHSIDSIYAGFLRIFIAILIILTIISFFWKRFSNLSGSMFITVIILTIIYNFPNIFYYDFSLKSIPLILLLSFILLYPPYFYYENYYQKTGTKISFDLLFFYFLIATLFSTVGAFIAYFIYSYVLLFFAPIHSIFILVLGIPIISLFIILYLFTAFKLLEKEEIYNREAFFIHKHFPFTILNKIKGNTTFSGIKRYVIIFTLLIFLVAFIGLCLKGLNISSTLTPDSSEMEQIKPFKPYEILEIKGYNYSKKIFCVRENKQMCRKKINNTVFHDCNIEMDCDKKSNFDRLNFEEDQKFLKSKKNNKTHFFQLPYNNASKYKDLNFFFTKDQDMRNLKITTELTNIRSNLFKSYELKSSPEGLVKKIIYHLQYYFTGNVYERYNDAIVFMMSKTKRSLALKDLRESLLFEYNWLNKEGFYDETTTKKKHKKRLRENIEKLKELECSHNKTSSQMYLHFNDDSPMAKANIRIFKSTLLYNAKLKAESAMLNREKYLERDIESLSKNLNKEESTTSRILRLKAIETLLGKYKKECGNVVNITLNPINCKKISNYKYSIEDVNKECFCKNIDFITDCSILSDHTFSEDKKICRECKSNT